MKKRKVNYANVLLLIAIGYLLWTRVPVWYRLWKMEGKQAQAVSVINLNQERVRLPVGEGEPKIMIFWASWCPPCKVEMGRLHSAVADGDLVAEDIIAVNTGEALEPLKKFVNEKGWKFPVFIDNEGEASLTYNVAATPTLIFVDKDGKMDWVTSGVSPTMIWRAKRFLRE
jgi:cytochrome c biogenesis protein CcmG/thiol:disulfide interchange protein DsbE